MLGKKIKLFVAFIAFVSAISFGYSFLKDYLRTKALEETTKKEALILEKDQSILDEFTKTVTAENKKKYLDQVSATLENDELSDRTKGLLLIRKAITMSIIAGDDIGSPQITGALEIFKKFINSEDSSPGALWLRDFSIIAGIKLQLQLLAFPDLTLIDSASPSYVKYKNVGYTNQLSTWLALHDLAKSVSLESKHDIMNVSNMVMLESIILGRAEKDRLSSKTSQELLSNLEKNLASFERNELKPLFFQDNVSANIEPWYHYATGYDIYHSFDRSKLTTEINTAIDQAYEKSIKTAKQDPEFKKNIGIDYVLLYSQLTYLGSLKRRYGSNADTIKINALADNILSTINSSKEISTLAASYFIKVGGLNTTVQYFISLGQTNQNVANYTASIGIK